MTNTYMAHPRTMCAARPCRSPLACEAMDKCREAGADENRYPTRTPVIDSSTALYAHLCRLPSTESVEWVNEALPTSVNPTHVAELLEDDDINEDDPRRYLDALAARTIRNLMRALSDIATRAAVAHAQRAPSDDEIIADHIEDILKLAGDAHAGRAS